jgi:hypothetical protein
MHAVQWSMGRCVQVAAMQAQRLSVAFSNLGGILKMQGRLQDAIACYEHVALLQPQVPEVQVLPPPLLSLLSMQQMTLCSTLTDPRIHRVELMHRNEVGEHPACI